jgi:hypothetical protein
MKPESWKPLSEKTAIERWVDARHRSLPKGHPERLEWARMLREQRAFSNRYVKPFARAMKEAMERRAADVFTKAMG